MAASVGSRRTRQAVAVTAALEQARLAAGAPGGAEPAAGARTADPLVGDLRRGGLLPLLVLHFVAREPSYGNQLMERIAGLTAGAVAVNPNTMYPLLRTLEARGLLAGQWERPERRGRRFYEITLAGDQERHRLAAQLAPHLDSIAASVDLIRRELLNR
jgi:DNA-binding PadR family transcriptional regulator